MLGALLIHGALFVGFIGVYGRWLDEEITADVCLFGLCVELLSAAALVKYIHVTDSIFYSSWGAPLISSLFPTVEVVFCFDEISGFFLAVLTIALILCFFFLVEYFEYDTNTSTVVTLSALFSQAALLYFCAFDVCSLIFF